MGGMVLLPLFRYENVFQTKKCSTQELLKNFPFYTPKSKFFFASPLILNENIVCTEDNFPEDNWRFEFL